MTPNHHRNYRKSFVETNSFRSVSLNLVTLKLLENRSPKFKRKLFYFKLNFKVNNYIRFVNIVKTK